MTSGNLFVGPTIYLQRSLYKGNEGGKIIITTLFSKRTSPLSLVSQMSYISRLLWSWSLHDTMAFMQPDSPLNVVVVVVSRRLLLTW